MESILDLLKENESLREISLNLSAENERLKTEQIFKERNEEEIKELKRVNKTLKEENDALKEEKFYRNATIRRLRNDKEPSPDRKPLIFGEPSPDHLAPPEWERDRNPLGFDTSEPPNPFIPLGNRHRGPRRQ